MKSLKMDYKYYILYKYHLKLKVILVIRDNIKYIIWQNYGKSNCAQLSSNWLVDLFWLKYGIFKNE